MTRCEDERGALREKAPMPARETRDDGGLVGRMSVECIQDFGRPMRRVGGAVYTTWIVGEHALPHRLDTIEKIERRCHLVDEALELVHREVREIVFAPR